MYIGQDTTDYEERDKSLSIIEQAKAAKYRSNNQ